MHRTILIAGLMLSASFTSLPAQQGGTFTPDTTQSQDTNSGGPVGAQAVPRPTQAVPESGHSHNDGCEKMANTVSGERPAPAGAQTPQPQTKCQD
jgi:hypothetical protein